MSASDDDDMEMGGYASDSGGDTDEELKEAFAAGLLKPGLNVVGEAPAKKQFKNNVAALKQKLGEVKKDLPWIERLDMINAPAPIAPELAFKEEEHSKSRQSELKRSKSSISLEEDLVHNDFKREMLFYRQAQSAVLEGIQRLKSLGVPTKRPDDYFAQMAKTDEHMQKIREKLLSKEQVNERIEKVKKLRELKKYGKKVQVEVQQKRLKEKKQLMDNVKKFRKGGMDNLDFLDDDNRGGKGKGKEKGNDKGAAAKRMAKDKKFGFGGKKRGTKQNTKESADDISGFKKFKRPGAGGGFNKKLGKAANKRPGKEKRMKMKNKKKK